MQLSIDMANDQIDGYLILTTSWNDQVREDHRRRDVVIVRRFDKARVLLDHAFDVPSAFVDVSFESSCETNIRIGVNKDFHIEYLPRRKTGLSTGPREVKELTSRISLLAKARMPSKMTTLAP